MLVGQPCNPCWYPSSSSAFDNTYIQSYLPCTSKYIESPLGHLKPSQEKIINCLVVIVHQEQQSGRLLTHTRKSGSTTKGTVKPCNIGSSTTIGPYWYITIFNA